MIHTVVNFPNEGRSVLVVVIEKENHERMVKADPITLESMRAGGMLQIPMFPLNTSLLIAYEEDSEALYRLARMRDTVELIRWLERGRKWDPKTDGIDNGAKL